MTVDAPAESSSRRREESRSRRADAAGVVSRFVGVRVQRTEPTPERRRAACVVPELHRGGLGRLPRSRPPPCVGRLMPGIGSLAGPLHWSHMAWLLWSVATVVSTAGATTTAPAPPAAAGIEGCLPQLQQGYVMPPIARVGRPSTVTVELVANVSGSACAALRASVLLPSGQVLAPARVEAFAPIVCPQGVQCLPILPPGLRAAWNITLPGPEAVAGNATVLVHHDNGSLLMNASFVTRWTAAVPIRRSAYVPVPVPIRPCDGRLVGMMSCNIWRGAGRWSPIVPYRAAREPALSWYDDGDPEVVDWEIKWAVEHAVSFFFTVWYRAAGNQGVAPVKPKYAHWLHRGFFRAKYRNFTKFAIMWDNSHSDAAGLGNGTHAVDGRADMLDNVLPFWLDNYITRPEYLVVGGAAVVGIFSPDTWVAALGGRGAALETVALMNAQAKKAGLKGGLLLLGQYCWGSSKNTHEELLGVFNFTYGYHWPSFTQYVTENPAITGLYPDPALVLDQEPRVWSDQDAGPGPRNVISLSAGWADRPWTDGNPATAHKQWHASPTEFLRLARVARATLQNRSASAGGGSGAAEMDLSSHMLLLDNWNEFGEGHYLAPNRGDGFGYLDSIREVFGDVGPARVGVDALPDDFGLGPYDSCWRGTNTTPCENTD